MKKKVVFFLVCLGCIIAILTGILIYKYNANQNNANQNNNHKLGSCWQPWPPEEGDSLIENMTDTNTVIENSVRTNEKNDRKIYKYIKMSSANGVGLLYSADYLFDNSSEVSSGDTYYKPCLIAEFDTKTGKAKSVKFYTFFLDYEDDEWVNKALEKFDGSSLESKKIFTNVQKGRVNDNVSYLTADVDVDSYIFVQYVEMLIKDQDIEKYKDEIFFSRLYNYDSEPPHEEGENYFEESLEGIRIEWSDEEIKAF